MTATLADETRRALRCLAQSVTVITCQHGGERAAMAATAINALSLDPPSLLACVHRNASMHAALRAAPRYAINVLQRRHEPLSKLCGGGARGEARFADNVWKDVDGLPVLADAQAAFLCTLDRTIDYGSHTIFIGLVQAALAAEAIDPLLYVDGQYAGIVAGGGEGALYA
ncbi:flavin reductase family protein [Sphingomonas sp. TDK1]|uniref:flavin reductase family protein n=1 Tax=Sphingomonas sp. TDK1 TaxID=453247 RepID=UPI0007D927DE|nr:flavin reductase family protein [Sphingomonas sp. TDK1]OAN66674.1 hypothetical protein A7X12_11235 [Sphingomonas sp. TDK1]